ncbi:MAG: amidohydrolase family protein [Thermodesulfobacteriota bacterium]
MKRICIEEHWGNSELFEVRKRWMARTGFTPSVDLKATPQVHPRLVDIEEFRLPLMDESGIAMQVLSTSSPGIQAITDAAKAISLARRTNDSLAEVIGRHPDRFAGFAALPTQDPKAAAEELERAVTQLGFKGAMIQGHTNGEYLDGNKYWLLWERVEALQAPIYLHVQEPLFGREIYEGHDELRGPGWSWVVETATHALRIVGSGVFDAFPKATLILGHMGEGLPYLLGRFDEGVAMAFKPRKLRKLFSEYIRENIAVTTSGKYKPEAMACAISAMGAERVLFAADYPWVSPQEAVEHVERCSISDSDKEKIYYRNAERLLKL